MQLQLDIIRGPDRAEGVAVTQPNPSDLLQLLAYRVASIKVGRVALHYMASWQGAAPPLQILFGGRLAFDGNALGFTNAALETAILHARATLEFIGLRVDHSRVLRSVDSRRGDDAGIETLGLARVSTAEAIRDHDAAAGDVGEALAYTLHLANKGLAHTTLSFVPLPEDFAHVDTAFKVIPSLVERHVFAPCHFISEPIIRARRRSPAGD